MVSILVEEPWFPWLFSFFYWFSINYLYTCCYMVVHVVFWFRAERTSKLLALFHLFATFKKSLDLWKIFLIQGNLDAEDRFFHFASGGYISLVLGYVYWKDWKQHCCALQDFRHYVYWASVLDWTYWAFTYWGYVLDKDRRFWRPFFLLEKYFLIYKRML